jgi:molybdopterin synthase sulfur carrier subunit
MWLISMSELKLVYFAWVRERIGVSEERVIVPDEVRSVAELAGWLQTRGEEYAYAFENPAIVRAAIDRKHVKPDTLIAGASEIAFFPPMTGG